MSDTVPKVELEAEVEQQLEFQVVMEEEEQAEKGALRNSVGINMLWYQRRRCCPMMMEAVNWVLLAYMERGGQMKSIE
jgi:hypothetical protein